MSDLQSFFSPKSVAVIGVSSNLKKLGSNILQNIISSQFKGSIYGINPKMAGQKLLNQPCYAEIQDCPEAIDLAVIVIPSKYVMDAIDDCQRNKTKNVIVISAGFGEVENHELENRLVKKCDEAGINLLGPNCLGAIFPHVNLNASFADGYPKKGNICFVSQSGALCTAMLDWAQQRNIGFSHFISLGNKAGFSEVEILEALADSDEVDIFAFYLESLKDGKRFLELIKKVAPHKPIIILEPGRSVKAAQAASSHTGSLAPNYKVLQTAYRRFGVIQVDTMRMLFGVIELLSKEANKNFGKNIAVITNAGGVGVLTTDLIEQYGLKLSNFSKPIQSELKAALPLEANIKNPVDLIGDAKADRYKSALEICLRDENVDQILVLLTPQSTTEIEATAQVLNEAALNTKKLITASFIGGSAVSCGIPLLEVPHYEFPVDVTRLLGKLATYQAWKEKNSISIQDEIVSTTAETKFSSILESALEVGLPSLPQKHVDQILEDYGLDTPKTHNFTDKDLALSFAKKIFPNPVVLKISSPEALHKTDLKGVVLNISDEASMVSAWQVLQNSIKTGHIKQASIQVQEQIEAGTEIILGINYDENFGHVMLFGAGGIYTEVFADTAVRTLPNDDFIAQINETKVSQILHGTRGEKPRCIDKLIYTMKRMQQLVLDYPAIKSIDANPVIMTETRAVCVDFKILV